MKISFATKKLQKICESRKNMQKAYGDQGAKKLQARLSDLESASSVFQIPVGRPHTLKGDRKHQLGITIIGGLRLVLEPANDPIPIDEYGNYLWELVTEARVVAIEDYHD